MLLEMHVTLNFTVIKASLYNHYTVFYRNMWLKFSMLAFLYARNKDFVLMSPLFCPVDHGLCDHKGWAENFTF